MTTNLITADEIDMLCGDDWLDSSIYQDPRVFTTEIERIFYSTWIYVAHESELRNPGDFKTVTVGTQPLLVVRDRKSDTLMAFYNRCAHRGALLCEAPSGNQKVFMCPYHGWTYDTAGNLKSMPLRSGYGDAFDLEGARLNSVPRIASYKGLIFVCLSTQAPGLLEWLAPAQEYLDLFLDQGGGLEVGSGTNCYVYDGNWKLQVENALDDYHLPLVHRSYFATLNTRSMQRVLPASSNRHLRSWSLGNGHGSLDFREPGLKEGSNVSGSLPFNLWIFPNLGCTADHIRIVTPLGPEVTQVELVHVVPKEATADERLRRIRRHEDFYGPGGFAMPDDLEVPLRRVTAGIHADRMSRRIDLSRGIDREQVDEKGRHSGHLTDEVPARGFYRCWRRLMSQTRDETC